MLFSGDIKFSSEMICGYMCKWTCMCTAPFHLLHKRLPAASSSHNTVATCIQEWHRVRIAVKAIVPNAKSFPMGKKRKKKFLWFSYYRIRIYNFEFQVQFVLTPFCAYTNCTVGLQVKFQPSASTKFLLKSLSIRTALCSILLRTSTLNDYKNTWTESTQVIFNT